MQDLKKEEKFERGERNMRKTSWIGKMVRGVWKRRKRLGGDEDLMDGKKWLDEANNR